MALHSPYQDRQLWAVAPFANESGVSIVQTERIADLFVEQAEQIRGIDTVPVNRVLMTMHRLGMRSIATPADAVTLMNVLGVDGLIVGTVTAYDPYPPLKLGAAIQLFHRSASTTDGSIDPVAATRARTDGFDPDERPSSSPGAQASGVFDASNHRTLMQLDEYAAGRTEPGSAYGKRVYLMNMELYTQFVAFRLMHDLLKREHAHLTPEETQPTAR